ncbi:hypothetical protein ACH4ZU_33865 [Streptomyces sp. NPDC020472]|uniref:hypothetical protein n=1 Tax=Streptomyces sp. NPDC020472 TaxID=3365075 RepID=UPI003789CD4F
MPSLHLRHLALELLVLGDCVAEVGPLLVDSVRDGLDARPAFPRRPPLVRTCLGDHAACPDAGLAAWQADGHPTPLSLSGAPRP